MPRHGASMTARTLCRLAGNGEPRCAAPAVVAVRNMTGAARWGCEQHAAAALQAVAGGRIEQVADWDACGWLLALP
jgi:hypothetical protein